MFSEMKKSLYYCLYVFQFHVSRSMSIRFVHILNENIVLFITQCYDGHAIVRRELYFVGIMVAVAFD